MFLTKEKSGDMAKDIGSHLRDMYYISTITEYSIRSHESGSEALKGSIFAIIRSDNDVIKLVRMNSRELRSGLLFEFEKGGSA